MTSRSFTTESPAGKILDHLQRHGEATVKELEDVLGVSTTAVREHLTHLQVRDLITMRQVRQGPGRPRQMYFLTPTAQQLFPKAYDTLVIMLLREITEREGAERTQALLDAVGMKLAEEYRAVVKGGDRVTRLDALRQAMEERGVPVEVQPSGEGFQVFACPYLDVAQEHAGICTMERRMLEQVLGEPLHLSGTIREGRRKCHFNVVTQNEAQRTKDEGRRTKDESTATEVLPSSVVIRPSSQNV